VGVAQWFDFGTNAEGVTTYRVNAHKDDLERIINEIRTLGFEFWEKPEIVETHKNWSVLLRIFIRKNFEYDEEFS
jgi:hypothetical protein